MHAVIISPRMPPIPNGPDFGVEKRFRLFLEGIHKVCSDISFVYFVPEPLLTNRNEAEFSSQEVWGIPGSSMFIPSRRRRETFLNHYMLGIVGAQYAQGFFPFAGKGANMAIRAAVSSKPDLIFVDQLHAMSSVLAVQPRVPVLFDLNDIVHRVHWRTVMSPPFRPGKIAYALQTPALLALERRAVRLAMCTTVCAEADRQFLSRLGAADRAVVVPNAVALPAAPPPIPAEPTLLFLGNYAYEPNAAAAERLVRRIWPLVRRRRPDARLLLAGGAMERLPSAAAPPDGVSCLGFAADLAALYARTRVVCCPLDIGGGTRLKLIEAAAHARPMVSTRIGAEGLEFRDGAEILLRDDDAAFAAACIDLLADDALCMRLGTAARAQMRRCYEAGAVRDSVAALVRNLLHDGRPQ